MWILGARNPRLGGKLGAIPSYIPITIVHISPAGFLHTIDYMTVFFTDGRTVGEPRCPEPELGSQVMVGMSWT